MQRIHCLALSFLVSAAAAIETVGQDRSTSSSRTVVKIGAVGQGTKSTIFENLTTVLEQKGYPSTYVLYSSYDKLVDALDSGEIDIAWNTPLAHVQYHVRNQCESQTLAMRDVDVGLHVTLIAKAESGIRSLDDLAGKRVILGRQKYHEGMLSAHLLNKAVANFDKVRLVQLAEKDAAGKRTDTSAHILQALNEGRGDAAVVPFGFWKRSTAWREKHPRVKAVWTSPTFNHCVFTASKNFNAKLASQFTKLMTTLDPKDPLVAELNRLERAGKWLPGNSAGFESLVEAVQARQHK